METTESDRTAQNLSSLKGLENSNVHFPALTCWATIVARFALSKCISDLLAPLHGSAESAVRHAREK